MVLMPNRIWSCQEHNADLSSSVIILGLKNALYLLIYIKVLN